RRRMRTRRKPKSKSRTEEWHRAKREPRAPLCCSRKRERCGIAGLPALSRTLNCFNEAPARLGRALEEEVAMRHTTERPIRDLALILVSALPSLLAAQVPLDDQLKAQYTMVKMGSDSSGAAVVEAGTILSIKKGGILSVPYSDTSFTPTKYQDGQVHSPNAILQKGIGSFMKRVGKEQ